MRLPNFVVIGAPKCGTTSLHRYLSGHPDIYLPVQKELHYFSLPLIAQHLSGPGDRDVLASIPKSFEEYVSHYADVGAQPAVGEISTSYLYFSEIAETIREGLGDVRIVVMLRNPLDKAYSQYLHLVRDNRELLSFHDALAAEGQRNVDGWSDFWRYAASSLYTERLKTFFRVFGQARIKVLIFEEFIADTTGAIRDLLAFLGLRDDVALETTKVYHRSGRPRSKLMANILAKRSPFSRAARTVLPRRVTDAVQRRLWALNIAGKEPVDERSRKYLESYFRSDVRDLESLLGRRLPWFRNAFEPETREAAGRPCS